MKQEKQKVIVIYENDYVDPYVSDLSDIFERYDVVQEAAFDKYYDYSSNGAKQWLEMVNAKKFVFLTV